jgi:hypothetical protein
MAPSDWPTDADPAVYLPPATPRPAFEVPGLTPEQEQDTWGDHERVERARAVLAGADDAVAAVEVCWHEGRRAVLVRLVNDRDRHEARLVEALGRDRVVVVEAPFSCRELEELHTRVVRAADDLRREGIHLMESGPHEGLIAIAYYAADAERAERVLRERFGAFATFAHRGASLRGLRPQPFGSWHAEGRTLRVFYGLERNGERPGMCTAVELDDAVIVQLSILDSLGAKTLIGGFTPAHATVELAAPVAERIVVDNADNRARPHWTQVTAA